MGWKFCFELPANKNNEILHQMKLSHSTLVYKGIADFASLKALGGEVGMKQFPTSYHVHLKPGAWLEHLVKVSAEFPKLKLVQKSHVCYCIRM